MKTVCTLLGLSADASEESVHAAVSKILNRATTAEAALAPLQTRADTAETKVKELESVQVEADLDKYKNRFAAEKREGWKKAIIANRAQTIELLEGLPVIESKKAPERIHNRETANVPESPLGAQDAENVADQRREAVQEYKIKNRCSHEQATNAVRRQRPELFGLPKKN